MAATVRCPYCWHESKKKLLVQRCGEACKEPQWFVAAAECPHERKPVTRRFCPECRRALLREYIDSDGSNIAIIGTPGSGKSTYVGVLLLELRRRLGDQFNGLALDLIGDESRRLFDDHFRKPLEGRRAVIKTAESRGGAMVQPLIFSMKFPRGRRIRSAVTVFYDTAGENVLAAEAMDSLTRQLEAAQGILLLIDPTQMRHASEVVRAGATTSASDQGAVVERLAELLRERSRRSAGRHSTPLAIALTKVDLLLGSLDEASPLRRPSRHDGYYDENDGRDVHEEIRAWLEHNYGSDFDNKVSTNFKNFRYFGVSALGARPVDRNNLSPSGIHPHRVEDPMLWLLSRFGTIESKRGKR